MVFCGIETYLEHHCMAHCPWPCAPQAWCFAAMIDAGEAPAVAPASIPPVPSHSHTASHPPPIYCASLIDPFSDTPPDRFWDDALDEHAATASVSDEFRSASSSPPPPSGVADDLLERAFDIVGVEYAATFSSSRARRLSLDPDTAHTWVRPAQGAAVNAPPFTPHAHSAMSGADETDIDYAAVLHTRDVMDEQFPANAIIMLPDSMTSS